MTQKEIISSCNQQIIIALQKARTKLSDDAYDGIRSFLYSCLHKDGGFVDRAGVSDPYYSVFGYALAYVFEMDIPVRKQWEFIGRWEGKKDIDLVHAVSLVQCTLLIRLNELRRRFKWSGKELPTGIWSNVARRKLTQAVKRDCREWLKIIASYQNDISGLNDRTTKNESGTVYVSFLIWSLYQDLCIEDPGIDKVIKGINVLKLHDGSFANGRGSRMGVTSVTSAALILQVMGNHGDVLSTLSWLKERWKPVGGFTAAEGAPVADLLSTATALLALQMAGEPMGEYSSKCEEFINVHWDESGGFFGSISDMKCDCEYTYYALLALGVI